ncbi:MAG: MetQ/NlpA family ABC transporter substrate-binding protein [Nocardioides sp.]|uniref:MetQ/NlpA family ABC transporter substrate-binding protein n=1 Tax=Nocardioides sp. TaxID=35761 RepID=UPI003F10453C
MSETNAPLIEAPRRRGPVIAAVVVVVAAVVAGLLVWAPWQSEDEAETVRLGVVGAAEPYWETFEKAAEDEGIDVEIVDFSDYAQPNPAVSEGELDMNQFQHIVYLADYNVSSGEDLTPLGATAIYPLGLYSATYDSPEEIKDGETVVVPDDASNQARGLLILQSAGLIQLKDGGSIFSTLADVDEASSRVKVKAMQAALTPASLEDVAAAVVNNDFVTKAGLEFADAIAQDDPSDPNALPYVNIFAVRAEDKDNETYQELVRIYQETAEVQKGVQEASGNTAVMLTTPVADLVASLTKVEADTEAHKG